ncbi:hypothetical protein HispidOSU_008167 [Sigmodon hispidus]
MSCETGPAVVDPTLRRRIEPHEFTVFFDPTQLRKETCLLYEIRWGGRHRIWRHTGQNTNKHVEINFIEKITSERYFHPSTRCSITWFSSWSPCADCSKAIKEFLRQHPNVTLFIYVARLYYHVDQQNRQGLRDLVSSGVIIQIMTEQEYSYCWKNFVNYPPSSEVNWPRYPNLWMKLYILELYCIILGLPPCLKILRRHQHEPPYFTLTLQYCHYQRIPPYIFWATGLI